MPETNEQMAERLEELAMVCQLSTATPDAPLSKYMQIRIAEMRAGAAALRRVAELEAQLEARDQRKLYVWSDNTSYLAVAHAKTVAKARELLLSPWQIGESGDGSCPERDEARKALLATQPAIWMGERAEFALTESAELREQEKHSRSLEDQLAALQADKARLDWLEVCGDITADQASELVNGFRWQGKYRGNIRAAIDAARKAEEGEEDAGLL